MAKSLNPALTHHEQSTDTGPMQPIRNTDHEIKNALNERRVLQRQETGHQGARHIVPDQTPAEERQQQRDEMRLFAGKVCPAPAKNPLSHGVQCMSQLKNER